MPTTTATTKALTIYQEAKNLLPASECFPDERVALYVNVEAKKKRNRTEVYCIMYSFSDEDDDYDDNYQKSEYIPISARLHNSLAAACQGFEGDGNEYDDLGYWFEYDSESIVAHLNYLAAQV